MRQVTQNATSQSPADVERDKYPPARPDRHTDPGDFSHWIVSEIVDLVVASSVSTQVTCRFDQIVKTKPVCRPLLVALIENLYFS